VDLETKNGVSDGGYSYRFALSQARHWRVNN